ncbi:MAG: hypothetical protein NTV01_17015 [Bacteroidia bacterium]|nr:hypothetical protein [Bacteroidia bacterium]
MKKNMLLALVALIALPLPGQKLDMEKLTGLNARSIGPSGMSGRVTAIDAVETNPNIIYIGSASGGLWKTESGGMEWTPLFDKEAVASIGALDIYQANPDIIWAGTGEGNPRNSLNSGFGVYRSIDGGKTWELKGLEKTRNIHRIIIDPTNPDIVYVGAIGSPWGPHPERGVYKTTDGGETWKQILFTNELSGVGDMVMDPVNPNKLVVGMWEHQRWPWFLKSGGPGSGLYITWDGGKNWKKLTEKEGIPKGEIGRIGLAIPKSNNKRIYALIECAKNALYRSDDGGQSWSKMTDQNVSNRPFYYHEIHADPMDPDRVYNLFSGVSKTEDGGLTFENMSTRGLHPDHHAWYINPRNNNFLIDGNDGGLAISQDRGVTWRYVTNLPLGQFYHINWDLDFPYNVYGGLQDNGSWYGPSNVLQRGGIQYYHWQTVMGGDGFDMMVDSSNNRFGYAMSQSGSVGRFDRETGDSKDIQPIHPEGTKLRFNWNAEIAHDPFEKTTIYFASQFLHKSPDRGDSWTLISPDLTTNDTAKLKQNRTGGLTYDITGAETHCTIIAISPSPLLKDEIWIGTDDGNLQLTRDGGATWTNLAGNIKGFPKNAWIPQIHVSNHNPGEAFVVVNNYRQNDFGSYLFYTKNYGKTWTRMIDDTKVSGYCLSVIQDPVEPNLIFLGTEYGLYVSIDYGVTWTKWTRGFPTVSTMDLKIHPRENDLIIATFGRSVYIIDDIRPLRQIAKQGISLLDNKITAFSSPVAYHIGSKSQAGVYSAGNGYFSGQTKSLSGILTYSVKEPIKREPPAESDQSTAQTTAGARPGGGGGGGRSGGFGGGRFGMRGGDASRNVEPVQIEIFNASGEKIRTLQDYPAAGINKASWRLDEKGFRQPGSTQERGGQEPGGMSVFPGKYMVKYSYAGQSDSTWIEVQIDPRVSYKMSDLVARKEFVLAFQKKVDKLTAAMELIKQAQDAIDLIIKELPTGRSEEIRTLRQETNTIKDTLTALTSRISPERPTETQRASPAPYNLRSQVTGALSSASDGFDALSATQKTTVELAEKELKKMLDQVDLFFTTTWPAYKETISKSSISPFKDKPYTKMSW